MGQKYDRGGDKLNVSLVTFPRVKLGIFPTPLHEMPNLSRVLGGPRLFIKREDLSGLAMGGNKTRQVECVLAHAQGLGADTVITTASAQSNYCLQLAAGARKLGMNIGLALFRGQHPSTQGNVILQNIIGSTVKYFDDSVASATFLDHVDEEMEKIAEGFRSRGNHPCIIPQFRPSPYHPIAAVGWINGAEEIYQQLKEQNIDAQYLLLATGSSCTASGLILGCRILKSPLKIVNISVSNDKATTTEKILRVTNETAKLIGEDIHIAPDDIVVHDYVGEGYGVVSSDCMEAIRLLARTEGIFLDPVYSGKGMAGLIDLIRKGKFTSKDTVVFLHTGGIPAIFAYPKEMTREDTL